MAPDPEAVSRGKRFGQPWTTRGLVALIKPVEMDMDGSGLAERPRRILKPFALDLQRAGEGDGGRDIVVVKTVPERQEYRVRTGVRVRGECRRQGTSPRETSETGEAVAWLHFHSPYYQRLPG